MNESQKLPDIPLWTPRFSQEKLEALASDTSFDYAQGFEMSVIKPGDLAFPNFSANIQEGLKADDVIRRGLATAIGVDLSTPTRPGTAIVAVGVDPVARRRMISRVVYGAWKGGDIIDALDGVCRLHPNLMFVMVENNGLQTLMLDMIEDRKATLSWWMKVEAFTTGKNKADPQYGLQAFDVEFKNKAWPFPGAELEGHKAGCMCDWHRLKKEYSLYPKFPTCDGIMATWFAKRAIDQWMMFPQGAQGIRAGNLSNR